MVMAGSPPRRLFEADAVCDDRPHVRHHRGRRRCGRLRVRLFARAPRPHRDGRRGARPRGRADPDAPRRGRHALRNRRPSRPRRVGCDVAGHREAGLRATPIRKDLPFAITADGRRTPRRPRPRRRRPAVDRRGTPRALGCARASVWACSMRVRRWAALPCVADAGVVRGPGSVEHRRDVGNASSMAIWTPRTTTCPDGYDLVARHLARDLDIALATTVDLVRWGNERVTIDASDREWTARAAVVTVPPSVITGGGVLFEPALPIERLEAVASIAVGDAVSIVAVWSERSPESGWALAASEPSKSSARPGRLAPHPGLGQGTRRRDRSDTVHGARADRSGRHARFP